MNPIFQHILQDNIRKYYKKHPEKKNKDFKLDKKLHDVEVEIIHELYDFFYLCVGVVSAAFGLKAFLIPNAFIDGGVMGISLIANKLSELPLSILIVMFNLPFLILAYFAISKRFAFKSVIGIILLSVAVAFIPFSSVTDDAILIAAFGGIFLGFGIGMAIRGGAIIDGTEVLAVYISRISSLTVGTVILIFNVIIFLVAAWLLSVEIALYAILTYFAASKTVDFVIDGIEEFTGVTIVSDRHDAIRSAIINKMGRGCTVFKGHKGVALEKGRFHETSILYTVITRLEMSKLKTIIEKIDPQAFMVMTSVKDTRGGMIKKKPIGKIK